MHARTSDVVLAVAAAERARKILAADGLEHAGHVAVVVRRVVEGADAVLAGGELEGELEPGQRQSAGIHAQHRDTGTEECTGCEYY